MATTGWWCIGNGQWSTIDAIDEFGPGSLDGDPAHGGSNDACGPAAILNGQCAIEGRPLTYSEIGAIRADMITHGLWTQPAQVNNPRTGGATMANVADEMKRRGYEVVDFLDEQDATLSVEQVHAALAHEVYVVFMVFDATLLLFNEQGPHRHFVGVAAYGGDSGTIPHAPAGYFDEHGFGKVYVLNSDVAGQHGTAQGQWTPIDVLLRADVRAYAVMAKRTPPPPPPPTPQPDIPGAVVDINTIQQIVDKAVADALSKLQPK